MEKKEVLFHPILNLSQQRILELSFFNLNLNQGTTPKTNFKYGIQILLNLQFLILLFFKWGKHVWNLCAEKFL